MKRARVIIAEVSITKQGQVNYFQIRLPKNVTKIIAVETDVRIDPIRIKHIENGIGNNPLINPEHGTQESDAGLSQMDSTK